MKKLLFFSAILFLLGAFSCSREPDYNRLVKRELASGIRQDSLFLGLRFGMSRREFFDHCFELNRRHLAKEGPGGVTVEHVLPDQDPQIVMNFSPVFQNDRIAVMGARLYHAAWAPWNRKLWAPELQKRLITLVEHWYGGNRFIHWKDTPTGPVYVKVDGNRQTAIDCQDDQYVRLVFTDLTAEAEDSAGESPGGVRQ